MPHRSRSLVLRISSWASRQFSRCAAVAQANTMTYMRCHCRSARGNDTTASDHGQPGIPLLGPPRPAVLGHGEGDLGLQVRLGASRIGLPGGEQFDHPGSPEAASRARFRRPATEGFGWGQARSSCRGRRSCSNLQEAEQGTARDRPGTNGLAARNQAGPGQCLRPNPNHRISTRSLLARPSVASIADDCAPQRAPVYRQFAQIMNLGSG